MKKIFKVFVAMLLTITCIAPLTEVSATENNNVAKVDHVYGEQIDLERVVSRNAGSGNGTHKYPNYMEGNTQYYRDGDIIEVNLKIPANTGVQLISQNIGYDKTKVELLSSERDISRSADSRFRDELGWTMDVVAKTTQANPEIVIFGGSNNYRDLTTKDFEGGSIAKIYFKVLDGIETKTGTPIDFTFYGFQAIEAREREVAGETKLVLDYVHIGYDPAHDGETAYATSPTQTIIAKKPTVTFNAENGFIKQSQARDLISQNDLKVYNKASASSSDGSELTVGVETPSFANIKAGTLGVYDVTYKYTNEGVTDTKVVKLNVVSDDAVISPEGKFAITAKNAIITEATAKALADQSGLIAVNKAVVTMSDGTTQTPVVNAVNFADIKAGKTGSYDVIYSYTAGSDTTSKTVKVNVVKDGTVISPDQDFGLYAEHGFIKDNEAKALQNKSQVIPYNKAEVIMSDGTKKAPENTISSGDWLSITSGTKGTYAVLYQYGSGANEVNAPVKLTVIDKDAPVSPDGKASLYAADVELSVTEAKALTAQTDLIALTKAAVTLSDGSTAVPTIASVDFASIKAGTEGTYPITYTYGTGEGKVEKTVNVVVSKDKENTIEAKDKIITQSEAKALDLKEDLRNINEVFVTAIDGSHPNAIVTTSQWADIKAGKVGTYVINYSFGVGDKKASIDVKVVIVEDGSVIGSDASLFARNGFMEQSKAKELKAKEDLIPYNAAVVTLLTGDTLLPVVNVAPADWTQLNSGALGTYVVNYSHEDLSKVVNTTVIRDDSEVSNDQKASLFAKNAFIQASEAKTLANKEALKEYNEASVTLINGTSANATVTIDGSDWLSIKAGKIGTYDVMYSYKNGTTEVSKVVKISVIEDNPVISNDGNVALNAESAEITHDVAKLVRTKEDLIVHNKVSVRLLDGTVEQPEIEITETALNDIKAGKVGTYAVVYSYGVKGTDGYVSKEVTITVVQKTEERLLFDYDNNKRIDIKDFAEFRLFYAGLYSMTEAEVILSDASGDGRIDVVDLAECKYYVSNSSDTPPTVIIPIK